MIDGARMGMQATVQGIYNYNPKEMASAAVRGLHWVRNIGAPKLTRSPSVQDFQFSFLRVFIHQVRGLKIIKKGKASTFIALWLSAADGDGDAADEYTNFCLYFLATFYSYTPYFPSPAPSFLPSLSHYTLIVISLDGSQEDFNSTVMMKVELRNQPGQDPKIYQQKTR